MSIMPHYPDERAVENELGGKWEKFYEFTFEDSQVEGFEFPMDLDGKPLNLNGVLIVLNVPVNTTLNAITWQVYINNHYLAYMADNAGSVAERFKDAFQCKINNGKLDYFSYVKSPNYGNVSVRTGGEIIFEDSITNFKVIPLTSTMKWTVGTTLTIYVLRGV